MRTVKAFLALFCYFLVSGCSHEERIIDRINIVQNMGVDIEGQTIKMSASYPSFVRASKEQSVSAITAESNVMYGVFTALAAKSSQPVEMGQMRTLVVSEQFAREAISELADIINREFIKSSNATIVISRQPANVVITDTTKKPPFYLSELIEQNMKHGNTPRTNYHTFVNQFYGEGQDVYFPVIHMEQGLLKMDGVGVFKGEEFKLRLSGEEGLYLKFLKDKALTGEYDFMTAPKAMYSFYILHGKSSIAMAQSGKTAISLQLTIALREVPSALNTEKEEDMQAIKKQIEERLSSEMKKLLIRLQKNNVDPVGFGEQYRWRNRTFSEKEFYGTIYPKLDFDVKTTIKISNAGVGH
ncbi:Ger(x)C family spore germination protein [Paenibacillus silvisoli]|uniref:Ger(x)C family spore germination protein n=1 Tax=Paenibacillus silvisoli TaxID=3110539 RepID=UPI0028047818|nr:Ger(x)C family spore germination protein [Paenibacillus silvisoli]